MRKILSGAIVSLVVLVGGEGVLRAEAHSLSPSSVIRLQRDSSYEQNLKYMASADTTVTPAKVLRWMKSLAGQTTFSAPSNVEFQPIIRVHDSQKQVVAQIAYSF